MDNQSATKDFNIDKLEGCWIFLQKYIYLSSYMYYIFICVFVSILYMLLRILPSNLFIDVQCFP